MTGRIVERAACNGNCYHSCNHDVMVYLLNEDNTCFLTLGAYFCASRVELFTSYVFKSPFPDVSETPPKRVYAQINSFYRPTDQLILL